MQNPQLLEELLALLKQSEGFQSLPVSQQEMIIRTYESATDQQIERAIQEFQKTEDKVEHINEKEEKLIKKEMKIEQKVEKLEKKKMKLEKKEMAVVHQTVTEVSKHQMTIDDLTGEKPEVAPQKMMTKKVAKPVVEKPAKVIEKPVEKKTVKVAEKKLPAAKPVQPKKPQPKAIKKVVKNRQPVQKKSTATKVKAPALQKQTVKVEKKSEAEKKGGSKKGFFGFIKNKFFGGKK